MADFYKPARDFLTGRYTLKLDLGIESTDHPRFYVEITNRTRDVPLIVHEVRIHYGSTEYSHHFQLPPFESVTVTPKARSRFTLGYEPFETIVGRRYLTKKPVEEALNNQSDGPSFDSPAGLFNAIGMGKATDSWIEIDFNEYKDRRYMKGKIKTLFDSIGKTIHRRRVTTPVTKPTMKKKATLLLPTGIEIDLEKFGLTLGELIRLSQEALDDPNITVEGFGAFAKFFFVNSSTGSLIDSHLDLKRPLSTLFIAGGNVIELRLCEAHPQPDGTILNPMRGVTNFVK